MYDFKIEIEQVALSYPNKFPGVLDIEVQYNAKWKDFIAFYE